LLWFRIGTVGGLLWMWQWTFGFHNMWGFSWLSEDLFASQEELCFMKVSYLSIGNDNYLYLFSDVMFQNNVCELMSAVWEQQYPCLVYCMSVYRIILLLVCCCHYSRRFIYCNYRTCR
jgi:hypothetical protein